MTADLSSLIADLRTPPVPEAKGLPTVCVLCSANCGLQVDVEGDRIVKVRGDEANVYSHGYMCNKAASIPKYVDHDQRATRPLRRRPDGTFEAIDWDTAISEIGARLKKIREEHSPKSVALVGIGGQANHMDILYGLSFLELVGTPKWYNAYAQEKTQHHLVDQLLFDAPPGVRLHGEIEESDCVVYIGTNPRISNRVERSNNVVAAIGKDPSKYVITVDPRQTETTKTADLHVRVRPGTDAYLLLAVLKTIMEDDDLVDSDFLAEHATGAEELRAALGQVDVDEMSARCGVPRDTIELFARKFAEAERASILYDLGIEQIPFLTLVSYVIHLLPVVTGNLGKRGGMLFMGGAIPPERVVDRFEREPERALASGTQAIYALTNIRPMFSPSLVPEEILVDHPERIRALFVEGSNPYLSFSDTAKWREARQKLDLMVVIDPAMTETARDADYVLPVPSGYEKWEISSFPKGFPEVYMLVRRPVVSRRGDTRPEGEIYFRLLRAAGLLPEPPEELRAAAAGALEPQGAGNYLMQLLAATGGRPAGLAAMWTYELVGPQLPDPVLASVWLQCMQNPMARKDDVVRALGPQWQDKDPLTIGTELFRRVLAHPEGTEIARVDVSRNLEDYIGWPDGKVRLAPEAMLAELRRCIETPLPQSEKYPFVLTSGLRTRWTANTIHRDPSWRAGAGGQCTLHISVEDARRLGIESGNPVRLRTARGCAELPAEVDDNVVAGHVWVPNGYGMILGDAVAGEERGAVGVNLNALADAADRDPLTGIPHHKYTLCNVEPLQSARTGKQTAKGAVHAGA